MPEDEIYQGEFRSIPNAPDENDIEIVDDKEVIKKQVSSEVYSTAQQIFTDTQERKLHRFYEYLCKFMEREIKNNPGLWIRGEK